MQHVKIKLDEIFQKLGFPKCIKDATATFSVQDYVDYPGQRSWLLDYALKDLGIDFISEKENYLDYSCPFYFVHFSFELDKIKDIAPNTHNIFITKRYNEIRQLRLAKIKKIEDRVGKEFNKYRNYNHIVKKQPWKTDGNMHVVIAESCGED